MVREGPVEDVMKLSLLAAAAAVGAITLSGCVSDGVYGPPPRYADVDYGGYYDGYYGPFTGGYWGSGGIFFYLDQATGRYHRDSGRHFRREGGPGFNPIQGRAPPPMSGPGRPGGPKGQGPGPRPEHEPGPHN